MLIAKPINNHQFEIINENGKHHMWINCSSDIEGYDSSGDILSVRIASKYPKGKFIETYNMKTGRFITQIKM